VSGIEIWHTVLFGSPKPCLIRDRFRQAGTCLSAPRSWTSLPPPLPIEPIVRPKAERIRHDPSGFKSHFQSGTHSTESTSPSKSQVIIIRFLHLSWSDARTSDLISLSSMSTLDEASTYHGIIGGPFASFPCLIPYETDRKVASN
jgi:hypothetical protein